MALQRYRITFEPVSAGDTAIDPDRLGERSKLGGEPDWEQEEETPDCPSCGKQMSFVGQLDSVHHDSDTNPHAVDALSEKQQYMFGDVGMIYVFFCFECTQTEAVVQCG